MTKRKTNHHTPPPSDEAVRDMARDYKSIRADYEFDPDMFTQEPDRQRIVKWIVENKLSQVDQTLIILYADCLSYRKLGKRLGLSHTCVAKEIRRIRQTILTEYEKVKDNEHLF